MRKKSFVLIMIFGSLVVSAIASDHGDTPILAQTAREDANLTDLHAFVVGSNLVLALSTNAAIPKDVVTYRFPTDVTFEINIDHHSEVSPEDPYKDGGTVVNPEGIQEDLTYRIRFNRDGSADIKLIRPGGQIECPALVNFFSGLRADPFIRGPRIGRNVASIVLEVPLSSALKDQSTILIWATSKVDEFEGPFHDLAGRSLRSMFPENRAMNSMHPKEHKKRMGERPDLMIYDTSKPARYPNGRALTDDVVHLVGDPRVLANNAPDPTENDVPFLDTFPYLALPHLPLYKRDLPRKFTIE